MDCNIIQVNERTWQIEDQGVRIFLLAGNEKALLIDSGMNLPNAREIASSLTDLPLELLNTHADMDHIAGNDQFDWTWMHPSECANYYHGRRPLAHPAQVRPVVDGDVLDLGGRPLRIIHLPGHTPGSIAVLDVNFRVLISGDPIQTGNIFMFGPQRELHAYALSLRRLSGMTDLFDEIWPSHADLPVSPALIDQLRQAAEDILAGKLSYEEVTMFGSQKVKRYDAGCAGFLCD